MEPGRNGLRRNIVSFFEQHQKILSFFHGIQVWSSRWHLLHRLSEQRTSSDEWNERQDCKTVESCGGITASLSRAQVS